MVGTASINTSTTPPKHSSHSYPPYSVKLSKLTVSSMSALPALLPNLPDPSYLEARLTIQATSQNRGLDGRNLFGRSACAASRAILPDPMAAEN